MVVTEAQMRAIVKHRKKLKHITIDFNIEKKHDLEIFTKFTDLSKKNGGRKKAFVWLIENIDKGKKD